MSNTAASAWRVIIGVLIGAACAVVGMLPWLVHGARLTLQNLWATSTVNPADMPIVLLPFSQYELDLVASIVVIGSALAGIVARILSARGFPHARIALVSGALIAQLIALVQTVAAVAPGLSVGDEALVYLVVVTAWLVVAVAIGAVVYVLITRRARALAVIGIGVAAVVLEAWVRGFVAPIASASAPPNEVGLVIAHWLSAVAVSSAIVWAGVQSARSAVAAITALVILWLGSAALLGVASAAGSRALLRLPAELVSYFGLVFVSELQSETLGLAAVAAALAIVGLGLRWAITRAPARAITR